MKTISYTLLTVYRGYQACEKKLVRVLSLGFTRHHMGLFVPITAVGQLRELDSQFKNCCKVIAGCVKHGH